MRGQEVQALQDAQDPRRRCPSAGCAPACRPAEAPAPSPSSAGRSWLPCPCPARACGTATMRRSRLSRSASISSVSTVSASATGSMRPSTWVMSSSSKQRSTWTMASTSRILARNWLPSPSPFEAPRTRPAMSTKEMRVGMISFDLADCGDLLQTRIGHRDLAGVRLDGAEGIVGGLRGGRARQRVEKRRLADVGQPNDAAFETHGGAVLSGGQNLLRAMGERIDDRQGVDALPILQILGEEMRAAEFDGGGEPAGSPTRSSGSADGGGGLLPPLLASAVYCRVRQSLRIW